MSIYPVIQSAFNAGEISPQVYGRVDIDRYPNACKTLLNVIPLVQGPVERRPGFKYINTVKDSTKAVRLIPFQYSNTQAYILEFGDLYVRFYKDGGQILGGQMVTNGGMELDSNWADENAPATNVQSLVQQNFGLYSRHFTVAAGADEGIESDTWTSVSGETYTLDCYVYPDDTTDVKVRVRKGDDSGWLYDDTVTGLTENAWNHIQITLGTEAAGQGGAGAYIQFLSTAGAGAGEGWFVDDVKVNKDSLYETVSPYSEGELFDIDFAQSADTMYLAHKDHKPRTLTRSDHDEWLFTIIDWIAGPFLPINTTDITMTLSAATVGTGKTLTASLPIFYPTDAGRHFTQKHATTWGLAVITGYTSPTVVTVENTRAFGAVTANVNWKMGAWSGTTGFPSLVIFDKERLIWAASGLFPQSFWMSKVGIYTDHEAGADPTTGAAQDIADDDALSMELNAKEVAPLVWLESMKRLVAGATSIEWWLASATGDGPITALSKQAVKGSFNGSAKVRPSVADNVILYVSRGKNILRELYYSYEQDSFVGEDLTIISEHLTRSYGIIQMAYQKSPFSVNWMVRADGALLGLTYNKTQEVKGLHRHTTDGFFESIAVIPGAVDDEIWVIVKRNIKGSDVKYIERLHARFIEDDLADAFFVDSGLSLDNRQDITSITHADPGVINLVGHGYSDGNMVMFRTIDDDVTGEEDYDSLNYEEYEVAHKAANTFQLHDADGADVDLTEFKAVISATVGKMETSVSGLSHLEGETVSILADGATEPDQVVPASGQITLSGNGASVVHAGLPYNSDIETLPPNLETRKGTTLGDIKKIETILLKLYRTLGLYIGRDVNHLKEHVFTSDAVPMGRSAEMLSGDTQEISFNGSLKTDIGIYMRQREPLPLTISAVIYNVDAGE